MLKCTCIKIIIIFAFAIGFVSGTFLTTRYHFTVYVMTCLVLDQRCQLRYLHRQILHIFASLLVVILWILSICYYIDSIPQFLRN